MSDEANKIQENTDNINTLKIALQELGIVSNAYGKSAGLVEKQVSKMQAAFHKTPIVQLVKQFKGFGTQLIKLGITVDKHVEQSETETAQQKKSMTVMTRMALKMLILTKFGKEMGRMTKANTALWRRLTAAMFGIMSIFIMIGFAITLISIAFQGAETPLLDYTDGIWVLDEGLQGLIMVMTGEGEGGVLGAINVIVAAIIIAIPFVVLFGLKWAILAASITLAVGAYQLVNKETGDSDAAMAAATITATGLIGVYIALKFAAIAYADGVYAAAAAQAALFGVWLIAFSIIALGILGLYLFATGKVKGWMGWGIAFLSAALITIGLIIIVGLLGLTAPFWITAAIIIGVLAFVVAVAWKYRDKVMSGIIAVKDWILKWGEKTLKIFAMIGYGLKAGLLAIVGFVIFIGSVVIGAVLAPFIFIWKFVAGLWKDWKASGKSGWSGFLTWLTGLGPTMKTIAEKAFNDTFNAIFAIYNKFAEKMTFEIPDWVPGIGGHGFKLPQVPMLAKGGIVNKPTLAMIGEDGPEAVVPLSKKNNPNGIGLGGGGNNITINVNASGITDRSDKRALAREIGEAIREEMSRGGRSHGSRRGAL